jgi:hypothetical protein
MTPTSGKTISLALGKFWRKVSARNIKLVQSTCPQCNSFVGASPSPELLSFVENMHRCSGLLIPPLPFTFRS